MEHTLFSVYSFLYSDLHHLSQNKIPFKNTKLRCMCITECKWILSNNYRPKNERSVYSFPKGAQVHANGCSLRFKWLNSFCLPLISNQRIDKDRNCWIIYLKIGSTMSAYGSVGHHCLPGISFQSKFVILSSGV
jgi:hypothetical protein